MLDRKAIQEQIEPQIQDNYVTVKVTNGDIAIAQDNVDDNGIITLPSNEYDHMITENEKGLPYADKIFLDVSEVDLTPSQDVVISAIKFKDVTSGLDLMNPIYDFANMPAVPLNQQGDTNMQYTIDANKSLMSIVFNKVAHNIVMIVNTFKNTSANTIVMNIDISHEISEILGYSAYIYIRNDIENLPTYFLMQFEDQNDVEVFSKVEYTSNRSSGGTHSIILSNVDYIFSENSFDFSSMDMPWLQTPPTTP